MESLTPDTQAVLLLCGALGRPDSDGARPLTAKQYSTVAAWLLSAGMRPGDLLDGGGSLPAAPEGVDRGRLERLLDRGGALALVVEKWERSGLWVVSIADDGYPQRLRSVLGRAAPPLLYGIGPTRMLNAGGLTIVGSRDRSEEDAEYARRAGERCAREGITVISGAAKGIDRDAMTGALEAGGAAIGVLAEGLAKTATAAQYREDLMNERLVLMSPFDPAARWMTYAAMERNTLLYGLGDAALVVASAAETGGTWAGATEALKIGKVRVYVKASGMVSPGNEKLLAMGAAAFSDDGDLRPLMRPPDKVEQPPPAPPAPTDAYGLVIDAMLTLLSEPRTEEWMAQQMHVRAPQMKDWLERAVEEERVTKLKKPVRYSAALPNLFGS